MKKVIIGILIFILLAILIASSIILISGYVKYKDAIDKASLSDAVNNIRSSKNYVKSEDMSPDFKAALIAIEDHRFYTHSGIDIFATIHSIFVDITGGSFEYGGSGISQQTGRLLYFTQERTPVRKVAELFVAIDLEKNYSKDEILEFYANMIYYGDGYTGIGKAAKGYFNKTPAELTKDEAAFLAGVPNAPSIYSVNNELGNERKQQVLDAMDKYKDEIYK